MKTYYFDQAATSFPKPHTVPEAMMHYMTKIGCNINRSSYEAAYEAEETVLQLRQELTDFFHGDDCKNVVFTANVTTSLNMLLKGFLKPGDHVLVSSLEHNAVMRPLQQLSKTGVTFTRIPCDPYGNLDLNCMPKLLTSRTKAVIMTHASNVCGTLLPLQAVGTFCQDNHLTFIVDSAQTAGIFPIDMEAMHIDALAFTGHKGLLGPQGIGGFLLRESLVEQLEPLLSGGTGSISHTEDIPTFMPDRFEPGTPNIPGIYGLQAGLRYIQSIGLQTIQKKELSLTESFINGLQSIPSVKIWGIEPFSSGVSPLRAPVVSITSTSKDPAQLAFCLENEYQILTRVGLHCAPIAHKTIGTYPTGTVRFSFGYENTQEEINYALEALASLCPSS